MALLHLTAAVHSASGRGVAQHLRHFVQSNGAIHILHSCLHDVLFHALYSFCVSLRGVDRQIRHSVSFSQLTHWRECLAQELRIPRVSSLEK